MTKDPYEYIDESRDKPFVQGVLVSTAKFFLSWGALWLLQLSVVLYLVFEIATFPADTSGIVGVVIGLAVMTYAQYRAMSHVFAASQVITIEALSDAFGDAIVEGITEGVEKVNK